MYFFLLLFFFEFTLTHASIKRKPCTAKNENESQDFLALKKFKISENVQSEANTNITRLKGIDDISSDLWFFIGSFLDNPYGILSQVCKFFNETMRNTSSPQNLLLSRSTYSNLSLIPKSSPELNRLLRIENSFLNERFQDLLYPGSLFKPLNPETIEYAALFIMNNFQGRIKYAAYEEITSNLMKTKNYSALLRLIQTDPTITLNFVICTKFTELVWTAFKSDLIHLHNIKKSIRYPINLLIAVAGTPISLLEFQKLSENFSAQLIINAISASSCLLLNEIVSKEELNHIYARNVQIIESLSQVAVELVQWAKLCNDLKHSRIPDVTISSEFFINLSQYIFLSIPRNIQQSARYCIKIYNETLLICAILGNYKNVFRQILKMKNLNFKSKDLQQTLLKCPEFLKFLSLTDFKRIFGIKDQVLLLNHQNNTINISLETIYKIKNVYEKLRVFSEFFLIEDFAIFLENTYRSIEFSFSQLISKIITADSQKIVPVVNKILEFCQLLEHENLEIKKIGQILGNPKYIRELLKSENSQFLLQYADFNKFYIIIDGNNFMEILNMSEKLKEDQAINLRLRFQINWKIVFKENSIFPDQIIKLFNIYGIVIGDFSDFSNCSEIISNYKLIFDYPEIFGKRADKFLTYLALSLYYEEATNPSEWLILNPSNPMLFKGYGIFQLWINKNLKSFLTSAPLKVINAFRPNLTEKFISSAIFSAKSNFSFVNRLFTRIIPKNTTINLIIESISDLFLFFHESIKIVSFYFLADYKLNVNMSWLQLIESSGTIQEYEIILSIISFEELKSISLDEIQKSHNAISFFNYVKQNLNQRIFPETNREYLRNIKK